MSSVLDKESEEEIFKQREWQEKSHEVVRGFGDFYMTQVAGA